MYFVHHVARLLVTRTILYAYACYQAQPLHHFITVSLALVLHVRTSCVAILDLTLRSPRCDVTDLAARPPENKDVILHQNFVKIPTVF